MKRIPDSVGDQIVKMYLSDVPVNDIAGRIGYSTTAVRNCLKRLRVYVSGTPKFKREPKDKVLTDEERSQIDLLNGAGWPMRTIADQLCISLRQVYGVTHGIDDPPKFWKSLPKEMPETYSKRKKGFCL